MVNDAIETVCLFVCLFVKVVRIGSGRSPRFIFIIFFWVWSWDVKFCSNCEYMMLINDVNSVKNGVIRLWEGGLFLKRFSWGPSDGGTFFCLFFLFLPKIGWRAWTFFEKTKNNTDVKKENERQTNKSLVQCGGVGFFFLLFCSFSFLLLVLFVCSFL